MSQKVPHHYEVLGVSPSVSMAELTRRYKKLSLEFHPDRAAYRSLSAEEESQTQQRFQSISESYIVLSDPITRHKYDTQHAVNYQGRVSSLQQTLEAHNSRVVAPKRERGEDDGEDYADSYRLSPHPRREAEGERGEEDEESDYDPEENVVPFHATRSSHSLQFALRSVPGQEVREVLRTVSIERLDCSSPSPSWGLTFRGTELLSARRGGGIPYPATVTQVNGECIADSADVAAVLVGWQPGAGPLELTLSFRTEIFELAGDIASLAAEDVREMLVPASQQSAEFPLLFRDHAVLSCNGSAVGDATELRMLLREQASEEGTGKGRSTVLLECVV